MDSLRRRLDARLEAALLRTEGRCQSSWPKIEMAEHGNCKPISPLLRSLGRPLELVARVYSPAVDKAFQVGQPVANAVLVDPDIARAARYVRPAPKIQCVPREAQEFSRFLWL